MKKNWGVIFFLVLGVLSIFGAIGQIGNQHTQLEKHEMLIVIQNLKAGIITILGSLAFLSAKQRNGSATSAARIVFEIIAMVSILSYFLAPDIWNQIAYNPIQSFLIPVIAVLFYVSKVVIDYFKKRSRSQ